MRITWKACSNTECGVHPRDAFNKLADDTDAAGLEVILWQLPDLWNWFSILVTHWTSLVAQMVKASAYTMRETLVWSLGQKDPLEKEMATHSSSLVWKIPWMEKPDRLQSMGSQRVGHNWVTHFYFSSNTSESKGLLRASEVVLVVKKPPANAGNIRDVGSIHGSWRSPGGGHGNPLQYSRQENPMDRGAWWTIFHRVAKNRTWLKWLNT